MKTTITLQKTTAIRLQILKQRLRYKNVDVTINSMIDSFEDNLNKQEVK